MGWSAQMRLRYTRETKAKVATFCAGSFRDLASRCSENAQGSRPMCAKYISGWVISKNKADHSSSGLLYFFVKRK